MNKTKFRFTLIYLLAIFISNLWSVLVFANDFHDAPYNFLFGNHLDSHQETKIKIKNGHPVSLKGSLFIIFTGEIDPVSGLPIAEHPSGSVCEDDETADDCVVGWKINGLPGEAKFLYHSGVNGNDHPVWMVNRVDIPQPGSYTHFHWITTISTDPRTETVPIPDACNQNSASQLADAGAANQICPGWFLEIKAIKKFAFNHGGEIVPVRPGIDNATHLNLVTNYAEVSGITPTRSDDI